MMILVVVVALLGARAETAQLVAGTAGNTECQDPQAPKDAVAFVQTHKNIQKRSALQESLAHGDFDDTDNDLNIESQYNNVSFLEQPSKIPQCCVDIYMQPCLKLGALLKKCNTATAACAESFGRNGDISVNFKPDCQSAKENSMEDQHSGKGRFVRYYDKDMKNPGCTTLPYKCIRAAGPLGECNNGQVQDILRDYTVPSEFNERSGVRKGQTSFSICTKSDSSSCSSRHLKRELVYYDQVCLELGRYDEKHTIWNFNVDFQCKLADNACEKRMKDTAKEKGTPQNTIDGARKRYHRYRSCITAQIDCTCIRDGTPEEADCHRKEAMGDTSSRCKALLAKGTCTEACHVNKKKYGAETEYTQFQKCAGKTNARKACFADGYEIKNGDLDMLIDFGID